VFLPREPEQAGFWHLTSEPDSDKMQWNLDIQAVVSNAIENMQRMEEEVTLSVVIQFLRSKGYIVIPPKEEEDYDA
jgi:hypothetical protein